MAKPNRIRTEGAVDQLKSREAPRLAAGSTSHCLAHSSGRRNPLAVAIGTGGARKLVDTFGGQWLAALAGSRIR